MAMMTHFFKTVRLATLFLLLILSLFLSMTSAAGMAGLAIAGLQEQAAPSVQIEDIANRLGPFEIGGQQFTVLLRMKRVLGPGAVVDPDFQETLETVEILGPDGAIHHEQSFLLPEVSGGSFVETTHATAQFLQGSQGSGLLLTHGMVPSTPLGGLSWQVFGVLGRRLMPLSKPVFLEGDLVNAGDGTQVVRTSVEPGVEPRVEAGLDGGDMLHFRVWTGNFFVIIPLEVDWFLGKLAPAWQCRKMTSRGPMPICQVRVRAERIPAEEDMTFVRLHQEAHQETEEGLGTSAHVVVRKDSEIEFLAAETEVIWAEDENGVGLTVSDDVWLKVRIDGKEGWIHTQEDFLAIGLRQAGWIRAVRACPERSRGKRQAPALPNQHLYMCTVILSAAKDLLFQFA